MVVPGWLDIGRVYLKMKYCLYGEKHQSLSIKTDRQADHEKEKLTKHVVQALFN